MPANGVIRHLVPEPAEPPIGLMEQFTADAQVVLAYMKSYVRATLQPTVELVSLVGSYGLSQASILKEQSLDEANVALDTKIGTIVLSAFNRTADELEMLIDCFLPVHVADLPEGEMPMQVIPQDKARAALHRLIWLSGKLSRHLHQAYDASYKDARHKIEQHVTFLFSVIDRVFQIVSGLRVDSESLTNYMNLLLEELSVEELRAQAYMKETVHKLVAYWVAVLRKLASLLVPAYLSERLKKSVDCVADTYNSIVNVRHYVETVHNTMLGKVAIMEASLKEFTAIAEQLIDELETLEKQEIERRKKQNNLIKRNLEPSTARNEGENTTEPQVVIETHPIKTANVATEPTAIVPPKGNVVTEDSEVKSSDATGKAGDTAVVFTDASTNVVKEDSASDTKENGTNEAKDSERKKCDGAADTTEVTANETKETGGTSATTQFASGAKKELD